MRVRLRKIDYAVMGVCLAAAIGMLLYYLINKNNLPTEVPMQYSFTGKIRATGSRSHLLTFPLLLLFAVPGLAVVSMFPSMWNIPFAKVTEENVGRVSACIRNMLDIMTIVMTAVFTTIFICQARGTNAPAFILPLMLVIFLVDIIFWGIRTSKNA